MSRARRSCGPSEVTGVPRRAAGPDRRGAPSRLAGTAVPVAAVVVLLVGTSAAAAWRADEPTEVLMAVPAPADTARPTRSATPAAPAPTRTSTPTRTAASSRSGTRPALPATPTPQATDSPAPVTKKKTTTKKGTAAKKTASPSGATKKTVSPKPTRKATQKPSAKQSTDTSAADTGTAGKTTRAADQALAYARTQLGAPYLYGGDTEAGWDCSGLTQAAYRAAGLTLPRTSAAQSRVGAKVSRGNLRPGDLVFYYSPISHVGIYAGDGRIIHAPRPGTVVRYADVDSMPIAAIRRVG